LAAIACGRCSSGREMPDRKKSDTSSTCLQAHRNITIARARQNHARRSLERPVRHHPEPTPSHRNKAQFNRRRRPARSTPHCHSHSLNPMPCRTRYRHNGISSAPPAKLDRRGNGGRNRFLSPTPIPPVWFVCKLASRGMPASSPCVG
jgi:hypothetical protein